MGQLFAAIENVPTEPQVCCKGNAMEFQINRSLMLLGSSVWQKRCKLWACYISVKR